MKEGKDINEILNILVQKHFANFIKALQKNISKILEFSL